MTAATVICALAALGYVVLAGWLLYRIGRGR
jgi:hypothetical protein